MAQLPQVVVAQRRRAAQARGVGAVVVVQAQAGVPGALVFNLQVHIHRAREAPFLHQRHHLAAGALVQLRQLGLRAIEVGHLPFLQRGHVVADGQGRIVLRTHHPHAADLGFRHLQEDDAVGHLLLGQVHVD
ncbi:hypothetical protein D3C72_1161430 [compost metagenome]